jgi:hypothetical protein
MGVPELKGASPLDAAGAEGASRKVGLWTKSSSTFSTVVFQVAPSSSHAGNNSAVGDVVWALAIRLVTLQTVPKSGRHHRAARLLFGQQAQMETGVGSWGWWCDLR